MENACFHSQLFFQVKDPKETVHVITGLETYTQYLVSIQVTNPEGLGPASTVVVMTEEGGIDISWIKGAQVL